ncbi:MAG TPA: AI-2E family transporter [Gemmataceae bacterium]|nr:AI-2E family transporter [Gemmataceae bacterium]
MSEANGPVAASENKLVAVPSPKVEGPLTTGRPLRPVALAVLTIVLLILCAVLAWPFLPALSWAFALAVIAWPMHVQISRVIGRSSIAAAISTLAVFLLVFLPFLFVVYELTQEATSAAENMKNKSAEGVLKETMEKTPGLDRVVAWADRINVDLDREARKLVTAYTQDASAMVQGSLTGIIQAVVALFILYHLFKDRGSMLSSIRGLLPLTKDEAEQVFLRVTDSVHGNLYATLVTSLIDAIGGGLMFWLLGLPSPVMWGVVMFVLSILPIVGTFIVWMPAAAYLVLVGHWPSGLALVAWGVAGWIINDNYIYMWVAGPRMRLHQVPALLSFLGGLALFGASGMILGPAILAVTVAVLEVWHRRAMVPPEMNVPGERSRVSGPIMT